MFHQEICLYHGTNHQVDEEKKILYLDHKVLKNLGLDQDKYMEAPILIPPNWQLECHVHTNASLLAIGVMLADNPIGKYD